MVELVYKFDEKCYVNVLKGEPITNFCVHKHVYCNYRKFHR